MLSMLASRNLLDYDSAGSSTSNAVNQADLAPCFSDPVLLNYSFGQQLPRSSTLNTIPNPEPYENMTNLEELSPPSPTPSVTELENQALQQGTRPESIVNQRPLCRQVRRHPQTLSADL
ncbi:hypothetical protein BASA81_018509 [Batrachochytrium salamandrivorans]|nr:hypothetical protein BASA81_018509 [Batrachochytrium salamandrivorans]